MTQKRNIWMSIVDKDVNKLFHNFSAFRYPLDDQVCTMEIASCKSFFFFNFYKVIKNENFLEYME